MDALLIEEDLLRTPEVRFNPQGSFTIRGMSCSENAKAFFQPIIQWVDQYILKPSEKTDLIIRLKYFNTTSAKCLLEMLEKLAGLTKSNKGLSITWYYQNGDEDMKDAINTFEELIEYDIQKVAVDTY